MRRFFVADLNVRGELELKAEYRYDQLQQLPGAAELITGLATALYRDPNGFEAALPSAGGVTFRWTPSAATAGIAIVRAAGALASLSLLASGLDGEADSITLGAFQRHLLHALHDTGYEPAFALMDLSERPLVATINFVAPHSARDRLVLALADRCFGAAYFRYHGLA
jgi:hypothetical protein